MWKILEFIWLNHVQWQTLGFESQHPAKIAKYLEQLQQPQQQQLLKQQQQQPQRKTEKAKGKGHPKNIMFSRGSRFQQIKSQHIITIAFGKSKINLLKVLF